MDTVLFCVCESEGMKQWFFRVVGQWTYQINLVNQFGTADVVVCGCQVLRGLVVGATFDIPPIMSKSTGSVTPWTWEMAAVATHFTAHINSMFRRPCICESFLGQDPVLFSSLWLVWGDTHVSLYVRNCYCVIWAFLGNQVLGHAFVIYFFLARSCRKVSKGYVHYHLHVKTSVDDWKYVSYMYIMCIVYINVQFNLSGWIVNLSGYHIKLNIGGGKASKTANLVQVARMSVCLLCR